MNDRPAYMPRIVNNRLIKPADLQRLHEHLLETDVIGVISNEMRGVVENEWPELAYKLPPKEPRGVVSNRPKKSPLEWWAHYLRYWLATAAEISIIAWCAVIAAAVLWACFGDPE
jgi:hypothetical protein